jgi:hypothetical protein
MTGARCSDRAMLELPGNRAGHPCVTKDVGVMAQGTKGQTRAWLPVRAPDRSGGRLPTIAHDIRRHAREGPEAIQRP